MQQLKIFVLSLPLEQTRKRIGFVHNCLIDNIKANKSKLTAQALESISSFPVLQAQDSSKQPNYVTSNGRSNTFPNTSTPSLRGGDESPGEDASRQPRSKPAASPMESSRNQAAYFNNGTTPNANNRTPVTPNMDSLKPQLLAAGLPANSPYSRTHVRAAPSVDGGIMSMENVKQVHFYSNHHITQMLTLL